MRRGIIEWNVLFRFHKNNQINVIDAFPLDSIAGIRIKVLNILHRYMYTIINYASFGREGLTIILITIKNKSHVARSHLYYSQF